MADLGHDRAVYSISVTSELTGVNPQMLRAYENKGLLAPFRTEGGTRRYSSHDVERIGQITTLLASGLNLAGVEHVLRLQADSSAPLRAPRPEPHHARPRRPGLAAGNLPFRPKGRSDLRLGARIL